MIPIASEQTIYTSPDPREIYCYSPSLLKLPSGRILVSFDLGGPGVASLPGPKTIHGDFASANQCRVLASDDNGASWHHLAELAVFHARLFHDGKLVYLIGHDKAITISASADEGKTWTPVSELESSGIWHQAPCAVHFEKEYLYLTMERKVADSWPGVEPAVLRGRRGTDLTRRENWIFSNFLAYPRETTTIGTPFYPTGMLTPEQPDVRYCGPPGFLESHVVKIHDPAHNLYAPDTLYIWMRAHTGMANIAAIARCRLGKDTLSLEYVRTPAGALLFHVPCPGGHMKFHLLYDEPSRHYWMVATQSTDSMTRPDCLPPERYGLPDNERHRLALYFSRNLFDWCFAGMVAIGKTPKCSRHYASMITSGNDLLILSRSGDEQAGSAHNGNLITLHRVTDFRKLLY